MVKNHLANCRQGTQSALTRAEVSGGGIKPWRQKEMCIRDRSLCRRLKEFAAAHASTAECFQSNHEGAILDAIHAADGVYDAIVLNPGAYTHYSYAILDALKAVDVPLSLIHIWI